MYVESRPARGEEENEMNESSELGYARSVAENQNERICQLLEEMLALRTENMRLREALEVIIDNYAIARAALDSLPKATNTTTHSPPPSQ